MADILDISSDELLRFQRKGASTKISNTPAGQSIKQIINLVFKAVGLAMGVSTLVLSIIGNLESTTAITLLALGLTCFGIAQIGN